MIVRDTKIHPDVYSKVRGRIERHGSCIC